MEVDPVVVLLRHVRRVESQSLERIGVHHSRGHRLFDLRIEFRNSPDADLLLAVVRTPDRERSAPETAAAQVPVLDVLQPLSETAGAGGFRLPGDCLVEGHHLVLDGTGFDEPGIKRIVEHRKVGTPAVRIVVDVFLNLESPAVGLEHHAEIHVESDLVRSLVVLEIALVALLDITSGIFRI